MSESDSGAAVERIARFYDQFPYPSVHDLVHPLPPGFKRGTLDFLLRRRPGERLPANAKIWVAGCGTQQAVNWAMCFPEGEVIGTDVSQRSLDSAGSLASQLGLRNLRLSRHDLMKGPVEGSFDLVVSTGVIHHLPDPPTGLRHLRNALGPNGALVLMVYSRMHREALVNIRRAIEALALGVSDDRQRYQLAVDVLAAQLASERCSPPARAALEVLLERKDSDPPFVADCLLNPLERSYDIDELMALLDGAGLAHRSWLRPSLWELNHYVDEPELALRFAQLDDLARHRVIYHLAGHAGPLLELVCEPKELAARPEWEPAELEAMKLVCRRHYRVARVSDGQVSGVGEAPAWVAEGDEIVSQGDGPFGSSGSRWRLPAYVAPLLEAFDGEHTLAEIVRRFDDEFGREAILGLVETLGPLDVALLAPA